MGGDLGDPADVVGGHLRTGDEDAVVAGRHGGADEGLGEVGAVGAAADHREDVGADDLGDGRPALAAGGEVAGVDGARGGQVELGGEVVDGAVAVDPHLVVPAAQRLGPAVGVPLAAGGGGVVQDVAQAQDDAGAGGAQEVEGGLELAEEAAGVLVDDQDVGPEGGQRRGEDAAAHVPDVRLVHREVARGVGAGRVLGERGQGDEVAVRGPVRGDRLRGAGEEQDVRRRAEGGERPGDREVAAHVTETEGVVRVQRDAQPPAAGRAARVLAGQAGGPGGGRGHAGSPFSRRAGDLVRGMPGSSSRQGEPFVTGR